MGNNALGRWDYLGKSGYDALPFPSDEEEDTDIGDDDSWKYFPHGYWDSQTNHQSTCRCSLKTPPEYDKNGEIEGGQVFSWSAVFENGGLDNPKCCEVRQEISSPLLKLRKNFPNDLEADKFIEDRNQAGWRFGRRTGPYAFPFPNNRYKGDSYNGADQPMGWPSGTLLRFRLVVVDVCNDENIIYTSKILRVKFSKKLNGNGALPSVFGNPRKPNHKDP